METIACCRRSRGYAAGTRRRDPTSSAICRLVRVAVPCVSRRPWPRRGRFIGGFVDRAGAFDQQFHRDVGQLVVLENQHGEAVVELGLDRPGQLDLEHFLGDRRLVLALHLAERNALVGFRGCWASSEAGKQEKRNSVAWSCISAPRGMVMTTVLWVSTIYLRATRWISSLVTF